MYLALKSQIYARNNLVLQLENWGSFSKKEQVTHNHRDAPVTKFYI